MKSKVRIKQKEFEEAMAKKNITHLELADKLGIHHAYLSNIKSENTDGSAPSPHLRQRILDFFGIEFDDIFYVEPHEPQKKIRTPEKRRK